MGYRIVEMSEKGPASLEDAVEVGVYDSAYKAMDVMKQAFHRKGAPLLWYLLDSSGQVLAYPDDVYEAV